MNDNIDIEQNPNKVLGDGADYSSYPKTYDSSLLQRELRQNNRTYLGLDGKNLPFMGYDVWNCYEMSTLTKNGLPVTGWLKIIYPAYSEYIVESKSLKLFLQAFSMSKFSLNFVPYVREEVVSLIKNDLKNLLETEVKVSWIDSKSPSFTDDFRNYRCLEQNTNIIKDVEKLIFTSYFEDKNLLQGNYTPFKTNEIAVRSELLKSNCRVTKQPDWGDIYIKMYSNYEIDYASLLKYIVSFRNENHFHEEIVECVYQRLFERFSPSKLLVMANYSRRGGIDINPIRTNDIDLLPNNYLDINIPYPKTFKQ